MWLVRGYLKTCFTWCGDIGHAWQRWMTPYVGMTDDSRRQLGQENDYVGIYGHSPPMYAHAHTNTHILSSSKASSHLFDTVITAHTDSNDGWSPSLGYTFSCLLFFSYLTLLSLSPSFFLCHDILLVSSCPFSKVH